MTDRQNISLQIEGMTCDTCATHLRKALSAVAGVSTVDLPDWRAAGRSCWPTRTFPTTSSSRLSRPPATAPLSANDGR